MSGNKIDCPTCSQGVTKKLFIKYGCSHIGFRKYRCLLCSSRFISKDSVKLHLSSTHKTTDTEHIRKWDDETDRRVKSLIAKVKEKRAKDESTLKPKPKDRQISETTDRPPQSLNHGSDFSYSSPLLKKPGPQSSWSGSTHYSRSHLFKRQNTESWRSHKSEQAPSLEQNCSPMLNSRICSKTSTHKASISSDLANLRKECSNISFSFNMDSRKPISAQISESDETNKSATLSNLIEPSWELENEVLKRKPTGEQTSGIRLGSEPRRANSSEKNHSTNKLTSRCLSKFQELEKVKSMIEASKQKLKRKSSSGSGNVIQQPETNSFSGSSSIQVERLNETVGQPIAKRAKLFIEPIEEAESSAVSSSFETFDTETAQKCQENKNMKSPKNATKIDKPRPKIVKEKHSQKNSSTKISIDFTKIDKRRSIKIHKKEEPIRLKAKTKVLAYSSLAKVKDSDVPEGSSDFTVIISSQLAKALKISRNISSRKSLSDLKRGNKDDTKLNEKAKPSKSESVDRSNIIKSQATTLPPPKTLTDPAVTSAESKQPVKVTSYLNPAEADGITISSEKNPFKKKSIENESTAKKLPERSVANEKMTLEEVEVSVEVPAVPKNSLLRSGTNGCESDFESTPDEETAVSESDTVKFMTDLVTKAKSLAEESRDVLPNSSLWSLSPANVNVPIFACSKENIPERIRSHNVHYATKLSPEAKYPKKNLQESARETNDAPENSLTAFDRIMHVMASLFPKNSFNAEKVITEKGGKQLCAGIQCPPAELFLESREKGTCLESFVAYRNNCLLPVAKILVRKVIETFLKGKDKELPKMNTNEFAKCLCLILSQAARELQAMVFSNSQYQLCRQRSHLFSVHLFDGGRSGLIMDAFVRCLSPKASKKRRLLDAMARVGSLPLSKEFGCSLNMSHTETVSNEWLFAEDVVLTESQFVAATLSGPANSDRPARKMCRNNRSTAPRIRMQNDSNKKKNSVDTTQFDLQNNHNHQEKDDLIILEEFEKLEAMLLELSQIKHSPPIINETLPISNQKQTWAVNVEQSNQIEVDSSAAEISLAEVTKIPVELTGESPAPDDPANPPINYPVPVSKKAKLCANFCPAVAFLDRATAAFLPWYRVERMMKAMSPSPASESKPIETPKTQRKLFRMKTPRPQEKVRLPSRRSDESNSTLQFNSDSPLAIITADSFRTLEVPSKTIPFIEAHIRELGDRYSLSGNQEKTAANADNLDNTSIRNCEGRDYSNGNDLLPLKSTEIILSSEGKRKVLQKSRFTARNDSEREQVRLSRSKLAKDRKQKVIRKNRFLSKYRQRNENNERNLGHSIRTTTKFSKLIDKYRDIRRRHMVQNLQSYSGSSKPLKPLGLQLKIGRYTDANEPFAKEGNFNPDALSLTRNSGYSERFKEIRDFHLTLDIFSFTPSNSVEETMNLNPSVTETLDSRPNQRDPQFVNLATTGQISETLADQDLSASQPLSPNGISQFLLALDEKVTLFALTALDKFESLHPSHLIGPIEMLRSIHSIGDPNFYERDEIVKNNNFRKSLNETRDFNLPLSMLLERDETGDNTRSTEDSQAHYSHQPNYAPMLPVISVTASNFAVAVVDNFLALRTRLEYW